MPSPASDLQNQASGVRVSFTWMGTKKTLSPGERGKAAAVFGAEGQSLSASKKLIDTKDEAVRKLTELKGQIVHYWKTATLPYVEDGVRLIRRDDVDEFVVTMDEFRKELETAVAALDKAFPILREQAAKRLGELFRAEDYPTSVIGMFDVEYDFPSLEPPDWMQATNPQLYEQEKKRIAGKFEEAVRLWEQSAANELAEMVGHLADKLVTNEEGKKLVFKDSTVTNLKNFFERFKHLNVNSNAKLDELVAEAEELLGGKEPKDLREDDDLRAVTQAGLAKIAAAIDEQVLMQPLRRKINKPKAPEPEPPTTNNGELEF